MRVSELANELGKTSKEVLDIIKQKDSSASLFAASSVSKDQENMVRNAVGQKKEGAPKAEAGKTEPAKKKLTAVFRPQNAQQQIKRPVPKQQPKPQQAAPKAEEARPVQAAEVKPQVQETAAPAAESRPAQAERGDFQGRSQNGYQRDNRGERPQGGYQNRGDRTGGYQNRGDRPQGGYQNREVRTGGYQNRGDRPQGGYQNRGDRPQGGFQNRGDRPQGGGYQNRGDRPQGGYQNRDGRPQGGGYQNRGDRPQGGFQNRGDRPQGGGYQNRGDRPQGGFQNRDRNQGGFGSRFGEDKDRDNTSRNGSRDSRRSSGSRDNRASAFDSPIQTKPSSTRQANKNAHKNDRFDKRDREEDGKKKAPKTGKGAFIMPQPKKEEAKVEDVKTITLPERLTIKELADKMKLQPSVIVKKLFLKGQMVTLNQEIDYDQAEEIAMEFDVLCEQEEKVDVIAELLKEEDENEADMVSRPPVVCVMGHVDHGKTSLLDAIRQTNVTSREAGGITQHIGASVIEINGRKITFLDTPGHEAFTAMRMRGAQSTDIAILVVAADDGVMPQTVEAINHAKAAGVEIIVAINKIDKPSANVDKVKQELAEYELIPEDWGGSTIFVPVSAHTKEGITDLLEMVLLTADVLELKANPNRKGRGLVIEAELDKGKGPVATVLVQKGTLKVGDTIAAGACYGKIRAMMDDKGRRVKEAGPSTPVEILGLNDVPQAGEVFVATENEKEARSFAETFISESKNKLLEDTKAKLSLDDLFSQIKAGNVKELPLIIKADVQGSVEAVKQSLTKLSNEEVVVKVIHGGVGAINESDVSLASASNAIIIGFNVRPDATAKSIAEREKVDVRLYKVIYQAIEDVEAAMKGMLDPVFEEKVIGHAVIRQLFKASGVGTIAGSYVLDGKFQRGCSCRITREGEQIYDGPLASLKRFKDDVKEVAAGYECGLVFEKFNDLQEDDQIEAYMMVEVPR